MTKSCAGITLRIAEDRETTQSFEPVRPAAEPPPARAPERPPGPPPGFVLRDVWPWLALLGLLALGALLVWLFVLRDGGNKGSVVPAVVGLRQQQAIERLTGEGFGVKAIVGPASRPRGIVVSQEPGGGSRLAEGQLVTLRVSNGRPLQTTTQSGTTTGTATTRAATTRATTTTAAPKASVPDVAGQDLQSAAGQVEAAGLVAETMPVEGSDTAGTVVGQDPPAGTSADAGSVVILSVAAGESRPKVQVPSVVGQKSAAARAALLEAKLTAKTHYRKGPAGKVGLVLSQSPSGAVPAYTQVTIVVGS